MSPAEIDSQLAHRVQELAGAATPPVLHRLHGDASNRIYYRVQWPDRSMILMQRPQAGLESPSEEISKDPKSAEYPFVTIHRYLESNGVRVPRIFAVSPKQDLLLLEDLGPLTLEKKLQREPQALRSIYEGAIGLLGRWQQLKPPTDGDSCIAWTRRFDTDLLNWEFEHFIEWGIERSLNTKMPAHELNELRQIFKDIVAEIVDMPTLLCHRDFQSRNLMVTDDGFAVLDFQDALVGPHPYDLVALLRDSYIELSEEDLAALQKVYMKMRGIGDESKFLRAFDVQTIQRKLKDGGRFHYIDLFKKNPDFLPHAPASFRYAARALKRVPEGAHVLRVLKKYRREFDL